MSQNRPMWRERLASPRPARTFPGYQSRFGDGHPNRRQCKATARSTGERCKNDCLQGAPTCKVHGGYPHAYRAARAKYGDRVIPTAPIRAARRALAALGATVPRSVDVSIIRRGKSIAATLVAGVGYKDPDADS